MKIRKATTKDVKMLDNLDKKTGFVLPQYNFSKKSIEEMVKKGITIIAEDKEPVGFACLFENFKDGCELYTIEVLKSHHGKGIGTILLKEMEKTSKSLGKKKIYLYCYNKNFQAIQFYTKHNFFVIKIKKRRYSGGEDALLMCKELK
jgi:ribosomal protein S18 acetylase RimI-like enzyme